MEKTLVQRIKTGVPGQLIHLQTEQQAAVMARVAWLEQARNKQLIPDNGLFIHLILAGRGFGKTLTASQEAWWLAAFNPGWRIAMVAPTAGDLRRTIFEGDSGLLRVTPLEVLRGGAIKTAYNKSYSELHFQNGSLIQGFASTEPERLRGPQFHFAFCDELCFVAGTKISTLRGSVSIELVSIGDSVLTRKGYRYVVNCGKTRDDAELWTVETESGHVLTGTANHPVWTTQGFIPLSLLQHGMVLSACDMIGDNEKWQWSKQFDGMGKRGGCGKDTLRTEWVSCCIGKNTSCITGRFRNGWTCITKMVTRLTTASKTLRRYPEKTINTDMRQKDSCYGRHSSAARPLNCNGKERSRLAKHVGNAVQYFCQHALALRSVVVNAVMRGIQQICPKGLKSDSQNPVLKESKENQSHVWCAEPNSEQKTLAPRHALDHAGGYGVIVKHVKKLNQRAPVYNLEVADCHEYFANGLLVHNCAWVRVESTWDMLMFGLRLGDSPRVAITTTPKPIKMLKDLLARDGQDVYVVSGSTYENADNLAPSYLEYLRSRYEGTRLGRQELYAALLEDTPGALWRRDDLDKQRREDSPDLRRVVIAVDPAVSNKEGSDETGIIAAGLGADRRGYVLRDATLKGDPHQWAEAAVRLYDDLKADLLVSEVNNGGDLVMATVRTAAQDLFQRGERPNPEINQRKIHSSRGKAIRAEPIAALYAQGRVSHVHSLPQLEDQMCLFTSDFDRGKSGYSPDRVDALVFALSELMLNKPPVIAGIAGSTRESPWR